MSSIRTLNLLWERRFRGAYPISRFALCNDGGLAAAVPRPLESRSYDLTLFALDGGAEIRAGFAVETLLKLEVTGHTESCLGITADDLYLFHRGEKRRFLGERHLLYIDAALSEDARHLAVVFSDLAAASYALAYGEIGGRVMWMRDMDLPVTTVAMSRLGNRMVAGMENGAIQVIDSARRDVWEFGQAEPIRALACSEDGVFVVYGTSLGAVGLVDGSGTRRWEARLPGEVRALAMSANGRLCAALCRPEGDPGASRLFCIEETGRIGWEYEAEQPLVGLSLAASGRFLATATRSGLLTVYEVVPGEAATPEMEIALTDPLAETGDPAAACDVLQAALNADPGAIAVYERLMTLRAEQKRSVLEEAESCGADEDFTGAVEALEALYRSDPLDVAVITVLRKYRRLRGEQLLAQFISAQDHSVSGEEILLAALAADPTLIEARRLLAQWRLDRVAEADLEADNMLLAGRLEAGVAALERAQALAPTPVRRERLERAYTGMEFAAGMAAYHEKRYQEAQFQFKKALYRDPTHAEAKRYLAYAQRFAQDAAGDSLSDRFSYLE